MKKLFSLFILFAALTAIACKQPTGSNLPDSKSREPVSPGWYLYTTNANSNSPQNTYLYVNTSGAIERAGNSSNEYTGSDLEMIQQQLSYSICKKNADETVITFAACNAPSWKKVNNEPNTPSNCPYKEGEYLDVTKRNNFSWPVNKDLPLWSEKEYSYSCSCMSGYGYIVDYDNKGTYAFVPESFLSTGDVITINMIDTDLNTYSCTIKFTEAIGTNPGIPLSTGYEWWCFEDAYLNNGYENLYVLYFNGEATKNGIDSYEFPEVFELYKEKEAAINNYSGTKYKVTDLTKLPSWCIK